MSKKLSLKGSRPTQNQTSVSRDKTPQNIGD